jgi:hypothetical protein
MIFIWGKKHVLRGLGYVADFCPICRDLRTFRMQRLGLAGHFYYISFGEGQLVGHIRTCDVCGIELQGDPQVYKTLNKQKLPPAELAPLTRPDWREAREPRLAAERELASPFGKLPPEWRSVLLREPFDLLAARVEERFASSKVDWPTALAVVGFIAMLVVAGNLSGTYPQHTGTIWIAALVLGLGLVLSQALIARRRWMRRNLLPVLTLALRPLKPSEAELKAVLEKMKAEGRMIGRKVDVRLVVAELQRTGAVSSAGLVDAGDLRASGGT